MLRGARGLALRPSLGEPPRVNRTGYCTNWIRPIVPLVEGA